MAGDLNREASELWNSLKPIIDKEIDARTQGMVQRRKAKVTTAPSLATNTIGVTEPFGTEMFLPFNTNIMSASVGDFVWVEYMYGMTNAFVSMFASADDKDQYVAGNLTVGGVLDVTKRRCYATLSSAGWYRVMSYTATSATNVTGGVAFSVDFTLFEQARQMHKITLNGLLGVFGFGNEYSVTGTGDNITKIRYTYNTNNVGYVDIYFDGSSRSVGCCFSVYTRTPVIQYRFVAESLQSVADSPSGETVLAEYTFASITGMRVVHAQSSTSFGDAIATIKNIIGDNTITYGGNAANNLHAGISGFSDGVIPIGSSGGPRFFATLGKNSESYYAAELFTYNYPWRIRIRNINGTYHAELYYPNY